MKFLLVVAGFVALLAIGLVVGQRLRTAMLKRALVDAVEHAPGILASEVSKILGTSEVETRVLVRLLEDEGRLTTTTRSGDRRCWLT